MARKQLQNYHIAATPFSPSAISLPLALFAWTNIYGAAAADFFEYGGTKKRPENDVMPVDMPLMVSRSIVGI